MHRRTIVGAIATFRDLAEVKQLRDQVKRSEQMAFLGKMMSTPAEKIFDPFFTTKPEATGLGPAVVQKLLNDCGGTILLLESADEGAVFEIRLPSQAVLEQPAEVSCAA